ncbi:tetratricopeptide repeat protein [Candidatus Saccharibacteria bacterium]|nr:tetratricopeptide repeat protein [Candidatus Saccharibacteria bacterium]
MLGVLVVIIAAVLLGRTLVVSTAAGSPSLAPRRMSPQLITAVSYADRLFAEKRWLAAEKAYVNVLKLDHKNLTAYSHLGIIYSTQKNLADAIECFQIAVRLKPTASTHQNLATAYYENHNYIKAISAFEKAIMFEASASRYIGLSKAYKKVSNLEGVVTSLEQAHALDASPKIKDLLVAAYLEAGHPQRAHDLAAETAPQQLPSDITTQQS